MTVHNADYGPVEAEPLAVIMGTPIFHDYGLPLPTTLPGVVYLDDDGHPAAIFWHACPGREVLPARLPLSPERWQLVKREPLTISPSILCRSCGLHGFYQEGEWRGC